MIRLSQHLSLRHRTTTNQCLDRVAAITVESWDIWQATVATRLRQSNQKARTELSTSSRKMLHTHTHMIHTHQIQLTLILCLSFSQMIQQDHCKQIVVKDNGSHSVCVPLQIEGVPVYGLVDTGADITIIGVQLFKK